MNNQTEKSTEHLVTPYNGFAVLSFLIIGSVLSVFFLKALGTILVFIFLFMLFGLFTLQPNEARVLVLFGKYCGTVKKSGFHWANPFYSRIKNLDISPLMSAKNNQLGYKVSLRARTLNIHTIKVNDKSGNPIEIAAVVIWRVTDTARAIFDVDNYTDYVTTQSETALRHLASLYPYDHDEEQDMSLRSNVNEVSADLRKELQERVELSGITIEETRLSHLAYAQEIAQVMLRRQQAEAVISARKKIVHGAVSMVEMALKELSERGVAELDGNQKSSLVSNLMIVLCSESEVKPVINTGLS